MNIKKTFERLQKWVAPPKPKRTIKILSIDGGGIRGVIPAMVLAKIEEITKTPTAHLFDLIAGTSTGGILALGLTKPDKKGSRQPAYRAADWLHIYEEEGSAIFNQSMWERLRSMGTLWERKYHAQGIEKVLEKRLADTRLKEAITNVLITSYEMKYQNPCFFKSRYAKERSEFDFYMKQVARATSAAPTYFEPARLEVPNSKEPFVLIDGGVVANNPALCAYAEAKNMFPDAENFLVVSIGTGEMSRQYGYEQVKKWGLGGWMQPMFSLWFHGLNITVDYQLKQLLPKKNGVEQYYRFQTILPKESENLDNVNIDNIQMLKEITQHNIIKDMEGEIKEVCEQLLKF
ncbi:MAG: CBASS cGAMP-activated phospholipase [Chitinophagales bacterium]